MSRIISTDNYCDGGDYPDEEFLLWPMSEKVAQKIADILNEAAGEYSPRFYKVVPNDYVLKPGFEP